MSEKDFRFCICSGSKTQVTAGVNEKLSQGWKLHGTVFHSMVTIQEEGPHGKMVSQGPSIVFYQPMVKPD